MATACKMLASSAFKASSFRYETHYSERARAHAMVLWVVACAYLLWRLLCLSQLLDTNNLVVASTTTDAAGAYNFNSYVDDLDADTGYTVSIDYAQAPLTGLQGWLCVFMCVCALR